jgi:hypothetical protein
MRPSMSAWPPDLFRIGAKKSSNSRPFPFRRPCNGAARTRNPPWPSAPAVRNGGACGAAIRAVAVAPRGAAFAGAPEVTGTRGEAGEERRTLVALI